MRTGASYRLRAFGLCVHVPWRLSGADGVVADPAPDVASGAPHPDGVDGRELHVAWTGSDRLEGIAGPGAECVFAPPFTDGQRHFTVLRGPWGYQLSFDGFGRYAVSLDGREALCEEGAVSLDRCERFLFAQVLPLASVLQGLDVVHASAITLDRGVVAFVGPSGAGKTTVAARLLARGAGLVTDDALALEVSGGEVIAHPGPSFLAMTPTDPALSDGPPAWIGRRRGVSDKPHFAPPVSDRALPLSGVYHLEPRSAFQIAAAAHDAVPRMLGYATAPYVLTPDRLLGHLEVATMVTSSVPQFSLTLPDGEPTTQDLDALAQHIRALGS